MFLVNNWLVPIWYQVVTKIIFFSYRHFTYLTLHVNPIVFDIAWHLV